MMVFQSLGLCFLVESCLYTLPTYSTTHPGASSAKRSMFYPVELKLGTYMYIQVYTFMIKYTKVYTPIYSYKKASTTFHFESGLIRLVLPASFPSTLEPFIARSFLPVSSLLDCQTTQAGLAAPKLPQPGVNLVDIAAPPSVCSSRVSATVRKARILALAEHVRDRWR